MTDPLGKTAEQVVADVAPWLAQDRMPPSGMLAAYTLAVNYLSEHPADDTRIVFTVEYQEKYAGRHIVALFARREDAERDAAARNDELQKGGRFPEGETERFYLVSEKPVQ